MHEVTPIKAPTQEEQHKGQPQHQETSCPTGVKFILNTDLSVENTRDILFNPLVLLHMPSQQKTNENPSHIYFKQPLIYRG